MAHLKLKALTGCFLLAAIHQVGAISEETNLKSQFFGNGWPIKFEKNSRTRPTVEMRLVPPETEHPQVQATVLLLNRLRTESEQRYMALAEDKFNEQLNDAQIKISNSVDMALRIFDDPQIMRGVVSGALLPLTSKRQAAKTTEASYAPENMLSQATKKLPMFQQVDSDNLSTRDVLPSKEATRTVNKHANGPVAAPFSSSFLETGEAVSHKSKNGAQGIMGNALLPSFSVEVVETNEPSPKINEKIKELEQKRTDDEAQMIEREIQEFAQLKDVAIQTLEMELQLNANPLLVDVQSVGTQVEQQLPNLGTLTRMLSFRELNEEAQPFMTKKCQEFQRLHPDYGMMCGESASDGSTGLTTSFLEVKEGEKSELFGANQEINVKIAASEKPYSTIDEMVNEMERGRDATERAIRMKFLSLQLKLMKAMVEMMKDSLRQGFARVQAQYGPPVDAIKTEIAVEKLRD